MADISSGIKKLEMGQPSRPPHRHCAFCFKMGEYKLCGGCRKRAYCSDKCQKADWSLSGTGHHHKNWCRLERDAESLDFERVALVTLRMEIGLKKFDSKKKYPIIEHLHNIYHYNLPLDEFCTFNFLSNIDSGSLAYEFDDISSSHLRDFSLQFIRSKNGVLHWS